MRFLRNSFRKYAEKGVKLLVNIFKLMVIKTEVLDY